MSWRIYYNFKRKRQVWKNERKCETCEWGIRKKTTKKLRLNSVNLKTTSLWTCDLLKNVEHFYDYGHYGDPY